MTRAPTPNADSRRGTRLEVLSQHPFPYFENGPLDPFSVIGRGLDFDLFAEVLAGDVHAPLSGAIVAGPAIEAASEHGLLFANVPDTFVIEVADQAMMLILGCIRRVRQMDNLVRSGEWAGAGGGAAGGASWMALMNGKSLRSPLRGAPSRR